MASAIVLAVSQRVWLTCLDQIHFREGLVITWLLNIQNGDDVLVIEVP